MPLIIHDQHFEVLQATLTGIVFHSSWQEFDITIPEGLSYDLEIHCERRNVMWDGREATWEPKLQFDRFPLDAPAWFDIEHSRVESLEGSAQLDSHNPAAARVIAFGKRTGSSFATHIAGECLGIPFTADCDVSLDGYLAVGTFRDTDVSLTAMLARTIKLDGMLPQASTLDESIRRKKMRSKIFRPADDR